MFVRAMKGDFYPIRDVESFWSEKGSNGKYDGFAVIKDRGKTQLFYGEYERLASGPFRIIPAEPGYFALLRFEDDGKLDVIKNSVFGWAIEEGGGVLPITIEGVNNGDTNWDGILTPDGKVVFLSGVIHNTFEEYLGSWS